MPSTGKCPYCGSVVKSNEEKCRSCGAANENYVAETVRTVFLPKTIDELKEYCAERGMPLLRMRFFIGEDYKEPKAFGIYRDGDNFVVYKNKADGSRAVRYRGKDEEYAVNEIFAKLLEECHNRGIYPDGKDNQGTGTEKSTKKKRFNWLLIVVLFLFMNIATQCSEYAHKKDGYYRVNDNGIYYNYGRNWYYSDYGSDDWYSTSAPEGNTDDYYVGNDWNSDWGDTSFKSSEKWNDIQESNSSSSSDYDSWDSSDTDWDSDW